jgi:hypothetical protein
MRIAWSVAWGIICVVLIAMWVRSYGHADSLMRVSGDLTFYRLASDAGTFYFAAIVHKATPKVATPLVTAGWEYQEFEPTRDTGGSKWLWYVAANEWHVGVPAWFTTFVVATLMLCPWLPWQYSLRTLLIAVTLVAVGLGWAVYSMR